MYADAIATVVLEVQSNPKALKGLFLFLCHVDLLLNNMCLLLFPPDLWLFIVMETQNTIMDITVFQARLGVMLQYVF